MKCVRGSVPAAARSGSPSRGVEVRVVALARRAFVPRPRRNRAPRRRASSWRSPPRPARMTFSAERLQTSTRDGSRLYPGGRLAPANGSSGVATARTWASPWGLRSGRADVGSTQASRGEGGLDPAAQQVGAAVADDPRRGARATRGARAPLTARPRPARRGYIYLMSSHGRMSGARAQRHRCRGRFIKLGSGGRRRRRACAQACHGQFRARERSEVPRRRRSGAGRDEPRTGGACSSGEYPHSNRSACGGCPLGPVATALLLVTLVFLAALFAARANAFVYWATVVDDDAISHAD